MWKIALVLLLFVALGGLFVYQNYFINDNKKMSNDSGLLKVGDNAIYVADQKPSSFILISLISLDKNGYVVIYDDVQGKPGNIIGSTKILPKGESKLIIAGLIRPTISGEILFAVLHQDSGDSIFTPSLDIPFRDEDGNIISMSFNINRDASEVKEVSF